MSAIRGPLAAVRQKDASERSGMKRRNAKMRAFLRKHSDDLLMVAAWGMIVYGTSLLSMAAAWIIGGVLCLAIAVAIELGGRK